jgi:hypothetical protein
MMGDVRDGWYDKQTMNASARGATNSVEMDCKITPFDKRVMDGSSVLISF